MKRILFFLVFGFVLLSVSYGKNYSIKNRLNTKLSVSFNRTNEPNVPFMHFENYTHPFQARLNLRAECNYGVLNWLEVGGYFGYIRYLNINYYFKNAEGLGPFDPFISFAPTFGVNVNVHLLPFFAKNKDCRWEWYLTAKYGGAYLINHDEFEAVAFPIGGNGTILEYYTSSNRYRHIYGVGMGGGVYFGKYSAYMQKLWQGSILIFRRCVAFIIQHV